MRTWNKPPNSIETLESMGFKIHTPHNFSNSTLIIKRVKNESTNFVYVWHILNIKNKTILFETKKIKDVIIFLKNQDVS